MALPARNPNCVLGDEATDADGFRAFVLRVEPRLHAAFVAAYGHDRGRDAAAEALAYAWEHWDKVEHLDNPVGYLYRVGQSRVRSRRTRTVYLPPLDGESRFEPKLLPALESLSERQRQAVILVHVEGWTLREVAELLGLSIPTVQKHVERAMTSLRRALRINNAGDSR
jgi:DNA-directed RNA polymerase specialized sigma24 family protein